MQCTPFTRQLLLSSPDATTRAARQLGARLVPGDIILLSGDVGAGKTHFARQLILSILAQAEDIPSPTFTLVQTYDTLNGPLWHSDLYRISSSFEIEELGLTEAFDSAICLIEWPEMLGDLRPETALSVHLKPGEHDAARVLDASWSDPKWRDRLSDWDQS